MSMLGGALALGRTMTAARFTETLTFVRITESTDPTTLRRQEQREVLAADIPGQISSDTLTVAEREQADQLSSVQSLVAKVAVGAVSTTVVGDVIEVTASTSDPSLTNRRFRIEGTPQPGQVTAHRYPISEVS